MTVACYSALEIVGVIISIIIRVITLPHLRVYVAVDDIQR